jgi:hypothetical protein
MLGGHSIVGGLWVQRTDPNVTSSLSTTQVNFSKQRLATTDFPFPDGAFPSPILLPITHNILYRCEDVSILALTISILSRSSPAFFPSFLPSLRTLLPPVACAICVCRCPNPSDFLPSSGLLLLLCRPLSPTSTHQFQLRRSFRGLRSLAYRS